MLTSEIIFVMKIQYIMPDCEQKVLSNDTFFVVVPTTSEYYTYATHYMKTMVVMGFFFFFQAFVWYLEFEYWYFLKNSFAFIY